MIGLSEIKRIIPHRYPILLIDRILDVDPGRRLTATKAVTGNEPCYQRMAESAGPGDYAYPPSLLLESLAQAAVLLAVWEQPNPDVLVGKVELAGAINEVRFGPPVFPGAVLEHRVRMVKAINDTAILAGETIVDGVTVVEVGHFVLALRSMDVLRPSEPLTAVG